MGTPSSSDAFKRDAIAQIPARGYLVAEVSQVLCAVIPLLHASI